MTKTITIEEAAKSAAGNWRKFEYFDWYDSRKVPDPDNWFIWNIASKASRLVEQSNAATIRDEIADAPETDWHFERFNHFGPGWVDAVAIRVYNPDKTTTEAFQKAFALAERLQGYAVLDEGDYSQRVYDATLENFKSAAYSLKQDYNLPEDWPEQVYSWLNDNCYESAIENRDDKGGYPKEQDLIDAFIGLGFAKVKD